MCLLGAAIRVAAHWYTRHLHEGKEVLLLTNDRDCLLKARNEGLPAMTIQEYAQGSDALMEMLAVTPESSASSSRKEESREGNPALFEEHFPLSEVVRGVKEGKFFQGAIRFNRFHCNEAYLACATMECDLLIKVCERLFDCPSSMDICVLCEDLRWIDISVLCMVFQFLVGGTDWAFIAQGWKHCNRAVDGDIVAVQVLPESEWVRPSRRARDRDSTNGGGSGQGGDSDGDEEELRNVEVKEEKFEAADLSSKQSTGELLEL